MVAFGGDGAEVKARASLRRTLWVSLAVALGIAAVFLVVFSTSAKQIQIGVLLGLWAGLIAAFVAFGSRRTLAEVDAVRESLETQVAELRESQITLAQVQTVQASQTIELRQRVEEARMSEIYDPSTLRRELNRLLTEQIGSLRDEIAGLRAEMVDKLGNELRLERIETTRIVGSDLEALQREIRKLTTNQTRSLEATTLAHEEILIQPIQVPVVKAVPPIEQPQFEQPQFEQPVAEELEPAVAEPVVTEQPVAEPVVAEPDVVEAPAEPTYQPVAQPVVAQPVPAQPVAAEAPPREAEFVPRSVLTGDIFDTLPRLPKVPDEIAELLLPDEDTTQASAFEPGDEAEETAPHPTHAAAATDDDATEATDDEATEANWHPPVAAPHESDRPYVGRRRARDTDDGAVHVTQLIGSDAVPTTPAGGAGGGRRRAPAQPDSPRRGIRR